MSAPIGKPGPRVGRRAAELRPDPASDLRAILEHVTQGVAMFDDQHQLTVWNRRLPDILGVSDAQLARARTLEGLIRLMGERGDYGTSSDAVEAMVREHIASLGDPYVAERMLPDGRVLEFRRNPLANGAYVVIYTDVTERRHTEYMLQDSTRELRAMLEKAPVALAVIGQEDGLLKHVNARFRKLFGLSSPKGSEQLALNLYVSDQDQARILSAQADQRSVDFETAVRRADGSELWVLISSVRYVFDWEPATLTSFHDISDRRRAEASLQEELDRKRAELAEARTLQLELTPPPLRGRFGNFAVSIDVLLEPAKEVGGDLVDYFQIDEGLLVVAAIRDVTERKRAEEERERLRQLEADLAHINRVNMMGELAAALAHEIKQPIAASITSASACLRWLAHDPPDLERARAAATRIEQEGNRAADIINSLRSFYKTGTPAERQPVDVKGTIQEMTALLGTEAARHAVTIRAESEADMPHIPADRVQLQQVLMNLMLNAIEAMKDTGGELTIRSGVNPEGHLTVSISDTGVGLPAEGADLIFDPFHTTKPQGTGMGLTITRSIVESYGGRVWATANQGAGATFHFTLPTGAEAHA